MHVHDFRTVIKIRVHGGLQTTELHQAIIHDGMSGCWVQDGGVERLSLYSLGINLPLPAVITAKRPTGTTPPTPDGQNKL